VITSSRIPLVVIGLSALAVVTGCAFARSAASALGASDEQAAAIGGGVGAATSYAPIGLEEELEYGGAISVMIVDAYGGLMRDEALTRYVNQVGWTVALHGARPGLRYYFGVLDSDAVQAMAAPGGYVFITRGLLRELRSEAELAGVLAHEVAHVVHKDTLDTIQNLKAKQKLGDAAGDVLGDQGAFSGLVDAYMADFMDHGHDKDAEFDADLLGADISAAAGYDPRALKVALERIDHALERNGEADFNRTHPEWDERYRELEDKLAELPHGGQVLAERFMTRTASIR